MSNEPYIACGMYAFTDELRQAWQSVFDRVFPRLDNRDLNRELLFETGRPVLLDDNLYVGHTCGYPLVTHLRNRLTPFCVPLFDVPGCSGKKYSSQIIVPTDADIESLADCRDAIVAINTSDSNSGMNALRHALAEAGAKGKYFRQVLITGGHLQSLEAVADGRAQLAAIDCVTYQLIADRNPDLVTRVRGIGFSTQTCGLPFVVPNARAAEFDFDGWIDALNLGLADLPQSIADILHLRGFEAVGWEDYASILELENFAVEAGYAELN